MYQVIDREILLSFNEMRILLYNMGFKSVKGILMPREEFRREEIIRSMHHMSLHGMICFTEEGFQIRPDLEELLRVIGEDFLLCRGRPDHHNPACLGKKGHDRNPGLFYGRIYQVEGRKGK